MNSMYAASRVRLFSVQNPASYGTAKIESKMDENGDWNHNSVEPETFSEHFEQFFRDEIADDISSGYPELSPQYVREGVSIVGEVILFGVIDEEGMEHEFDTELTLDGWVASYSRSRVHETAMAAESTYTRKKVLEGVDAARDRITEEVGWLSVEAKV